MKEESILKQSLILTAKLLGAFTVWTLLLAFVVVGITSRAVLAFSGADARKGEGVAAEADTRAKDKSGSARGPSSSSNVTRPNG
jgi:hypothetical protein